MLTITTLKVVGLNHVKSFNTQSKSQFLTFYTDQMLVSPSKYISLWFWKSHPPQC